MRWTLLALVACSGVNPARDEIERRAAVTAPVAGWTCPMHPEVHATEAGSCPDCGMPLVRAGG